jgi:Trk-type K+ transport system membrane component
MNPLIDQLAVGAIILGAIGFFVFRMLRNRRKNSCSSGCGCASAPKIKGR